MTFIQVTSGPSEEVFSKIGSQGFWIFEGQIDPGLPTETYWNSVSIINENLELIAVATAESDVRTAKPASSANSIRAYIVAVIICSEEYFYLIPTNDSKVICELCLRAVEAISDSNELKMLQILQSQASSFR